MPPHVASGPRCFLLCSSFHRLLPSSSSVKEKFLKEMFLTHSAWTLPPPWTTTPLSELSIACISQTSRFVPSGNQLYNLRFYMYSIRRRTINCQNKKSPGWSDPSVIKDAKQINPLFACVLILTSFSFCFSTEGKKVVYFTNDEIWSVYFGAQYSPLLNYNERLKWPEETMVSIIVPAENEMTRGASLSLFGIYEEDILR